MKDLDWVFSKEFLKIRDGIRRRHPNEFETDFPLFSAEGSIRDFLMAGTKHKSLNQ